MSRYQTPMTTLFYLASPDELRDGLCEGFYDYAEDMYQHGEAGASWQCPTGEGVRLHPTPVEEPEEDSPHVTLAVTVPLSVAELAAYRASDGTYWLPAKLLNTRATVARVLGGG